MWSDPHVRRVVLARFVSRVGGEAAFFVGIWGKAAFSLDATAGEIAMVMGALGVSTLIGASAAGVLVDRFDPRRVLIAGEIVFVPVAIGMVFANSIPSLVGMTFLLGLVGTPVFTAISSFGPYLTNDPDDLSRVNGLIEGAAWAAFVVGPAMGAVLAGSLGVNSIFIFDAATSVVAAVLVLGVSVRQLASEERGKGGGLAELRRGFTYTYSHRRLRFYVLLGSAVWLGFGAFGVLEPLFFRDILGVQVETLGWVNSILGLGLVAGTLVAGRLPAQYRTARVLTLLVGLSGLGTIMYVATDQLSVVVVAGVVWGLFIGTMAPLHRTLIQLNSPDEYVGRITSVTHIHSEVAHLFPLLIAPSLAAAFGVQVTLISSGLAVAGVALLAYPIAANLDRTREVEVPATALPDPNEEPKSVGH